MIAEYPDKWIAFKPGGGGGQGRPRLPAAARMATNGGRNLYQVKRKI